MANNDGETDFTKCFICEEDYNGQVAVEKPEPTSFQKIFKFVNEYQILNDPTWKHLYQRISSCTVEICIQNLSWYHRLCYQSLTNVTNLNKKKRKLEEAEFPKPVRKTRRSVSPYDKEKCFFVSQFAFLFVSR